jgi:hypothetical protein
MSSFTNWVNPISFFYGQTKLILATVTYAGIFANNTSLMQMQL